MQKLKRFKRENIEQNINDKEANTRFLAGTGLIIAVIASFFAFNWSHYVNALVILTSIYLIYSAGVKKCFIYDLLSVESPFPFEDEK